MHRRWPDFAYRLVPRPKIIYKRNETAKFLGWKEYQAMPALRVLLFTFNYIFCSLVFLFLAKHGQQRRDKQKGKVPRETLFQYPAPKVRIKENSKLVSAYVMYRYMRELIISTNFYKINSWRSIHWYCIKLEVYFVHFSIFWNIYERRSTNHFNKNDVINK